MLSIPNQGHYDGVTKTCGTLYIHFQMDPASRWKKMYRRQGSKLNVTLPMESFKSDGLAFRRTIPHPCGRNLTVVVDESILQDAPLGVGGREFITIPGMGMPRNATVPGENSLQIRVVMDLEKMEYIDGDFTIQSRYAIAGSILAFGASLFGTTSETVVNVTNPAWVHGRTSGPPLSLSSSVESATLETPAAAGDEQESDSEGDSDDDASVEKESAGANAAVDIDE